MFGNFKRNAPTKALTSMAQEIHPALQVVNYDSLTSSFARYNREESAWWLTIMGMMRVDDLLPLMHFRVRPDNPDWLAESRHMLFDEDGAFRYKDVCDGVIKLMDAWKTAIATDNRHCMSFRIRSSVYSNQVWLNLTSHTVAMESFWIVNAKKQSSASTLPGLRPGGRLSQPEDGGIAVRCPDIDLSDIGDRFTRFWRSCASSIDLVNRESADMIESLKSLAGASAPKTCASLAQMLARDNRTRTKLVKMMKDLKLKAILNGEVI
jgi:hypothetical protein